VLIASLLITAASISSCTPFDDDDSWKEKYGTRELLLT